MPVHIQASIGKDHYQTKIEAGTNTLIADESTGNGGQGTGMDPFELLASALAACTCITLRMYIDKKVLNIENIQVAVSITRQEAHVTTHFDRVITFSSPTTNEQKNRLLEIANLCPIHKALSKSIYVNTSI